MAGEWLKFEKTTPEKPEVWAMAAALHIEADAIVGKLLRVWSWFDSHTTDGNAPGVTSALLDRIAGVTGFATTMQQVGWLEISAAGEVRLPNFERHHGKTAKTRLESNRRVAEHRARKAAGESCNGKSVTKGVTEGVTKPVTREEEEKNKSSVGSPLPPAAESEQAQAENELAADTSAIGRLRARLGTFWKPLQLMRPEVVAEIGKWVAMGATAEDVDGAIATAITDRNGNPRPLPGSPKYLTPILADLIDARLNPKPIQYAAPPRSTRARSSVTPNKQQQLDEANAEVVRQIAEACGLPMEAYAQDPLASGYTYEHKDDYEDASA